MAPTPHEADCTEAGQHQRVRLGLRRRSCCEVDADDKLVEGAIGAAVVVEVDDVLELALAVCPVPRSSELNPSALVSFAIPSDTGDIQCVPHGMDWRGIDHP